MSEQTFSPGASLADFLTYQSEWRRAQAARFPNDVRNPRAAAALDDLSARVRSLPGADDRLQRLTELGVFAPDGRFHAGTASHRYITRVGFDDPPPAVREFLDRLIDSVATDRAAAVTGAWSQGTGSWRWQYPPGYTATFAGETYDVVEAIAEVDRPPEFARGTDGSLQIAPRALSTEAVRFRLRPIEWASKGSERWVVLKDLDDGPHLTRAEAALAPDRKHLWPPSEYDGSDTYRRGHGALKVGVVEKFELPRRDTDKRRLVGDYLEITGTEFRDVVVALEPHPVESLRHVRTVRMHLPTPEDPRLAAGAAVRAYIDRCSQENRPPSGWVNMLTISYWQGESIERLVALAESGSALAEDASAELRRQNYWRSHDGRWMQQVPSPRSTGLAVGGTTVTRTDQGVTRGEGGNGQP